MMKISNFLFEKTKGSNDSEMDVDTMYCSGRVFFTGGLIFFGIALYSCIYYSFFIITEVIISSLVMVWGICLMVISGKMEKFISKSDEEQETGRISPFYYELEPVAFKRDLPPIPRDIGREYDPIILDKV